MAVIRSSSGLRAALNFLGCELASLGLERLARLPDQVPLGLRPLRGARA